MMRGPKRKGVRYFGPYAHAWAIRETLDLLLRVFPARTCSAGVFKRAGQIGRPCLLGYIGKCSAPCVGRVTADEHREIVDDFCDFMAGKADPLIRRLEREMAAAARDLEFERAARLRDDLGALRRAVEKQAVVLGDGTDADVVGIAADDLLASVQVFHVRGGRVRGQRGWIVDEVEDGHHRRAGRELPAAVLRRPTRRPATATAGEAVPREILVPVLPEDADALAEWLGELRGVPGLAAGAAARRQAGAGRDGRPQRRGGADPAPAQAGQRPDRPVAALAELQEALGMAEAPLRIECIDISHVQGTNVVASMVVFEDGLAASGDYRRFAIRGAAPTTSRRSPRWSAAGSPATSRSEAGPPADRASGRRRHRRTGRPRRFAYPPQAAGGRRRRAAGRRGQPVARPSWASTTSPSAGWPSGWRRSGCPASTTR